MERDITTAVGGGVSGRGGQGQSQSQALPCLSMGRLLLTVRWIALEDVHRGVVKCSAVPFFCLRHESGGSGSETCCVPNLNASVASVE